MLLFYQVNKLTEQVSWLRQQVNVLRKIQKDTEYGVMIDQQIVELGYFVKAESQLLELIQTLEIQLDILKVAQQQIQEEENQKSTSVVQHLFDKKKLEQDDNNESYVRSY